MTHNDPQWIYLVVVPVLMAYEAKKITSTLSDIFEWIRKPLLL